jgi:hypothetical protein
MTTTWPCSRLNQPRRRSLYFVALAAVFLLLFLPYQLQTGRYARFLGQQERADLATKVVNKPFNASAEFYQQEELPFIVTIEEKSFLRPEEPLDTPNLYDILKAISSDYAYHFSRG